MAVVQDLGELLRRKFGFDGFRPFQEAVCRALCEGRDALLVMPTGAGKSLCYQLPGLARGGTTIVVSPLIALMEDQVAKLQPWGLAAERIHSGRPRERSREVCREYLAGRLDYLFIAPERLGVPGFPEFLARRTPALVAIDEAHCISEWGHDFRPDYRMLGERLPLLRPAPVIALTATATPLVQRDVLRQLGIENAERFIHGFRRTNLALEVVAAPPSARAELARALLADPERRPAIVYAPTRKHAEELARELGQSFPATPYHAGMTATARDAAQAAFLEGRVEAVVATIAFGMGIDKADVRTVVHTAMPASVEGYYQEIGRAGRDGAPARAVLLCGWSDRKTHEHFVEQDYPEVADLERVFEALGTEPRTERELLVRSRLDPETLERAVSKLWTFGGARVAADGAVTIGPRAEWRRAYLAQRRHKLEQLALIARFAESRGCRMVHLVRHFGDVEDPGEPCGQCDACAPDDCRVLAFREPDASERAALATALAAIAASRDGIAAGRLHRECFGEALPRDAFERLIDGLVRAGLVTEQQDAFERDGETIEFRRLRRGAIESSPEALDRVRLERRHDAQRRERKRAARTVRRVRAQHPEAPPPAELVETLRAWRLDEACRRRVPAFQVFSDRTLAALASERPTSLEELLAVRGIGPKLAERYGAALLALLAQEPAAPRSV